MLPCSGSLRLLCLLFLFSRIFFVAGKHPYGTLYGFQQSLLSENTLSSNLRLAEEEIESILKEEIKAEKKKLGRVKFWISVGASVVGSFIFIGILIITFAVANNQIKNLLGVESYGDQDRTTEIESTNDDQN